VAIVVPSGDMIHADTAWCIWQNSMHLFSHSHKNNIINPQSSLVQKGRWMGVKQALETDATHVMFVDSDMTMPPNTITDLLEHNRDIVGCYYKKRDGSGDTVGELIPALKKTGLVEALHLGTGMLMININVFKKMAEPWFNVGLHEGKWLSEDQYFCEVATLLEYKIMCDLDLSKEIGHIGRTVFK